MRQLLDAYAQPQRHYHTGQHLQECLTIAIEHVHCAQALPEVLMALWFHDAVYNVHASDNEQQSADWAARALTQAQVATASIARVYAHILATCHSAAPEAGDQSLVVDIDLAILGAGAARFDAYQGQVRQEYAWVPGFLFKRKRKEILRGFLQRDAIYRTPVLHARLESQARDNLRRALADC